LRRDFIPKGEKFRLERRRFILQAVQRDATDFEREIEFATRFGSRSYDCQHQPMTKSIRAIATAPRICPHTCRSAR
jgi:hypothetical protein